MKVPALGLRPLLIIGLGSLHGLILLFGLDDGLLGFLSFSLSPRTPRVNAGRLCRRRRRVLRSLPSLGPG
jgi:hypothetical protein